MTSRWLQDEDLPTWAHTALLVFVIAPFAGLLIWPGVQAVATGVLAPTPGPEFGQWMFGSDELRGHNAVLAGFALCGLGLALLSVAAAYSRWAQHHRVLRILPWMLLACAVLFHTYVIRAVRQ